MGGRGQLALKSCMDRGGSEESCAASAIRQANAVVGEPQGNEGMEHYSLLAQNYTIREEMLGGRKHLVVPIVMMTEGVHAGSHGPLYHAADELARFPASWDGIPVAIQHPTDDDGIPVSCNQPGVLDTQMVGRVFNTHMDKGKLRAEAWIDPGLISRIAPETLEYLRQGKPMDVSVGVFTEDDMAAGEWNGERYIGVARNHRPDHLALLPGATGACSWADGCGVRAHQKQGDDEMKNHAGRIKYDGTESTSWSGPTLADFGVGAKWESCPAQDRAMVASHFLIGTGQAETFGDLKFPVVNPRTGKLNENALRAVISGRGAQVQGVSDSERASARRMAYRMLNDEFDAGLEVPKNLRAVVVAESLGHDLIRGLASTGVSMILNEMGHDELRQKIQEQLGRKDDGDRVHYLMEVYDGEFVYQVQRKWDSDAPAASVPLGPDGGEALFRQQYEMRGRVLRLVGEPVPVIRKIEYVTMKMGMLVQEMGHRECSEKIQAKLDRMDDDSKVHFLVEVFNDSFIYRVKPGNGPGGETMYRRGWKEQEDGNIEFTGEAQPVAKKVEYMNINKGGNDMSKQPCCAEKVQMLIEAGLYTEDHRERLLAMEEADINVLMASLDKVGEMGDKVTALENEVSTLKANSAQAATREQAIQVLREELRDKDKFLALAPPEVRATLEHGQRLYRAERDQKIGHVLANTNNVYSRERLETMADHDLDDLARAVKAPADYSLTGHTPPAGRSGHEHQAVYPAGVE